MTRNSLSTLWPWRVGLPGLWLQGTVSEELSRCNSGSRISADVWEWVAAAALCWLLAPAALPRPLVASRCVCSCVRCSRAPPPLSAPSLLGGGIHRAKQSGEVAVQGVWGGGMFTPAVRPLAAQFHTVAASPRACQGTHPNTPPHAHVLHASHPMQHTMAEQGEQAARPPAGSPALRAHPPCLPASAAPLCACLPRTPPGPGL